MSKLTDRVYAISPPFIQRLGIQAFGLYWSVRRLGPVFEQTWREYVARESWSADRMLEFVEKQLSAQVIRAYYEVPYYREAFRSHGITEELIANFKLHDLPKLPLLEKAIVRQNPKALLTKSFASHPPASFATSGTTGTPIRVFWDAATHQRLIGAREARSFRWAGVSYRDSRSMIGGRLIIPKAEAKPPFWRYNRWERQLYLSAFHISRKNVPDYVKALNRYGPVTMTGYASGNFFLARFIAELDLKVHTPRAIITGSERLEPHMRSTLQSVFRTRAYEEYGAVENCALASECEHGNMHVNLDFGYMEILRPDGQPAAPGEIGEVVVTGFTNPNQLFIRYRIGDLASWGSGTCPCGRASLPMLGTLVGRQEDTVLGPDGRETVRFHGIFIDLPGVLEGQIVQKSRSEILVNLVPGLDYSEKIEDVIRSRIRTRLGPEISVVIDPLGSIPRAPNGKYRAVISHVQRDSLIRASSCTTSTRESNSRHATSPDQAGATIAEGK
jgi:phenylacetate-CoA ligase